jgi:hypothetical protein
VLKSAAPLNTAIVRKRNSLLMVSIDDQSTCHIPSNQAIIQNKAENLFSDMKAKKGEAVKDAEF